MPRSQSTIDSHVGDRVRIARSTQGVSRADLAKLLNISVQQMQKYEMGTNRLKAGQLYEISVMLQLPIQFFFELDDEISSLVDEVSSQQNVRALRAFLAIKNPRIRKQFFELAKKLAEEA
jgi:transcriptional regulator with XRE-family HTH domain